MNNIFNKLVQLQQKAYCVYSHYPVACIIIDEQGNEYCGVNIENSSYGLSLCAERSAIANMIVNGSKKIKEIHILCGKENNQFASACGACRQVISEFINKNGLIFLWNHHCQYKTYSIDQYLLDYFSNNFLKENDENE